MRRRRGPVRLSAHAFERWKQRVSENTRKKEVVNQIKARIAFELKNGADVNRRGALEIEVQPKIWAYCYPSLMGGWEVATIVSEGWAGDMEERAMYGSGDGGEKELKQAIDYFVDVLLETDKITLEQKKHFEVALTAMNLLRMARDMHKRKEASNS